MSENTQTGMQPLERDRLTRLETKVDFIIEHLNDRPLTLSQKAELEKIHEQLLEHHDFIEGLKLKIGIVGAGFMLFGTAVTYLVKYIVDHLNWGN
jgi:hypothetical protein